MIYGIGTMESRIGALLFGSSCGSGIVLRVVGAYASKTAVLKRLEDVYSCLGQVLQGPQY